MNRDDAGRFLIDAITASQTASRRLCGEIDEDTSLADIEGFDSLIALEVLVSVSERLGTEVPEDVLTPSTNGRLSVRQLADKICSLKEPRHGKS